jgi:hypothetical protein
VSFPRIGRRRCPGVLVASVAVVLAYGCASSEPSVEAEAAQVEPEEFVSPALEAQMAAVAAAIEQRGFASAGEPSRAFLVEGDALVDPTSLPTERCHVFVALGSQALREVSLGVFDSGGTELVTARGTAPTVALRYCPDLPGTHYVAIRALAGDGLVVARRFEGPSGIVIDLEDLLAPNETVERP